MAGKPNDAISLARLLRQHPTSSTPHAAAADAPQSRGIQPGARPWQQTATAARRAACKGRNVIRKRLESPSPQREGRRQTCQSPLCRGGFVGVVPRCRRRVAHFGPTDATGRQCGTVVAAVNRHGKEGTEEHTEACGRKNSAAVTVGEEPWW